MSVRRWPQPTFPNWTVQSSTLKSAESLTFADGKKHSPPKVGEWCILVKDSNFYQLISIMHLMRRVDQILSNLRPAFSRHAAYEWFVLLIWGILLCSQHPAITSYRLGSRIDPALLHPGPALVPLKSD